MFHKVYLRKKHVPDKYELYIQWTNQFAPERRRCLAQRGFFILRASHSPERLGGSELRQKADFNGEIQHVPGDLWGNQPSHTAFRVLEHGGPGDA